MNISRRRLGRAFYARPAEAVARDLLGRVFVRASENGTRLSGRIVETEAYTQDDPASHSYGGRTPRNAVMFGDPGLLYVYFTYGMHFCLNAVCGSPGEGSAVLIRALEPLEGLDVMSERRGTVEKLLCSGPARICQAFGIGREDNGADLVADPALRIELGASVGDKEVATTSRVGIRRAPEIPRRFVVIGSSWASRRDRGPATSSPSPSRS